MANSTRGDVLLVLDPLEQLNPASDSSYVMITGALSRGYRPFAVQLSGLSLRNDSAFANATPLALGSPSKPGEPAPLIAAGPAERRSAGDFRVILMRKDPPLDSDFITATWWLDRAGAETLVLNEPAGLRDLSEKLAILEFPSLIPRTYMLRDRDDLREVLAELGGQMILKPVYGYGGRGVLIAREGDPNLSTLFELATDDGAEWTIVQEFVPEATRGDKRILLIDGEPVGAVLRVPASGELRNNFHMGGKAALTELTPRDRQICARVGPYLRERGQFFVGLDVLGDYLTEINVTSPTGMQEVNKLHGLRGDETMEAKFWAGIERRLES